MQIKLIVVVAELSNPELQDQCFSFNKADVMLQCAYRFSVLSRFDTFRFTFQTRIFDTSMLTRDHKPCYT